MKSSTMLMNIHTGSVDTLENWQTDFLACTTEEWGGVSFDNPNLIEVAKDNNDDWIEVE